MSRSHLHLPITREDGSLVEWADVTFVDDDGNLLSTPLYADMGGTVPMPNPSTFSPGLIDIWADQPVRATALVVGPNGFGATIPALDLYPDPKDIFQIAPGSNLQQGIIGDPLPGQTVLYDGVKAYWGYLTLVQPHQHDGPLPGSTSLDSTTPAMSGNSQTWVGVASGSTGSADSTSSMGYNAEGPYPSTTVIGKDGRANGLGAVVVGFSSQAGVDQVAVGNAKTATSGLVIGPNLTVTSTAVKLPQVDDSVPQWGTAYAIPGGTPPANPVWYRTDVLFPGSVIYRGKVTLGSATSTIGFYGVPGATKHAAFTTSGAPAALANLVTALSAYGLC